MRSTMLHPEVATEKNFLSLHGIDFIELYTGNARQAAFYYRSAFGMRITAYAGPETGQQDRVSYVLEQGAVRLVVTGTLRVDDAIAHHVHRHGDSVANIAIAVDDARQSWKETLKRGARSAEEPHEMRDEDGSVRIASIEAFGDTLHSFVERGDYTGPFLPGYRVLEAGSEEQLSLFRGIDHFAVNVGWNEKRRWKDFYATTMGFSPQQPNTAMPTNPTAPCVMTDGAGSVKVLISEPNQGPSRSRIEEYLEYNHGSGVQHIALETNDLLAAVRELRSRGVEFRTIHEGHEKELRSLPGNMEEITDLLQENDILARAEEEGCVLQAFTRPLEDRPTLFFSLIEHKGAHAFSKPF